MGSDRARDPVILPSFSDRWDCQRNWIPMDPVFQCQNDLVWEGDLTNLLLKFSDPLALHFFKFSSSFPLDILQIFFAILRIQLALVSRSIFGACLAT